MKLKLGILFLLGLMLLLPVSNAQSQPDLIHRIGSLLQKGQLGLAQRQLDTYLSTDPPDVAAWIMQGMVVLYQHEAADPESFILTDESIFNRWNGLVETAPVLIPRVVASKVAGWWQRALQLDPSQTELREALAYLYAQALMTPELMAELAELNARNSESEDLKYLMCDLARCLADRNALSDAIEVYQEIICFYPDDSVVYAALADTLIDHGRLSEAGEWLERAAALPHPEGGQFFKTRFRYWLVSGEYSQAQQDLESWSEAVRRHDGLFFKGLLLYYNNNPGWISAMKRFLAIPYDRTGRAERELARFLISRVNQDDYRSYLQSLAFKIDSNYELLLHQRALRKFPDQAIPYLEVAKFHNACKNFHAALEILHAGEDQAIITPEIVDEYQFQYAWTLQNCQDPAGANRRWIKLFNAQDFFQKSAAVYFYGKNLWKAGNVAEAVKFFKMLSNRAAESKYAYYCQRMLRQLETGAFSPTATGTVSEGEPL